jgi:hypothetical protein
MAEQDTKSSLVALALALELESEVDPAAVLTVMSRAPGMVRRSYRRIGVSAFHCWALVTAARNEKGDNLASLRRRDHEKERTEKEKDNKKETEEHVGETIREI